MLYGLLEVLSTVSADTEGLRYTSDVVYFLCPSLAGIPPWQPSSDDNPPRYTQSSQERSYCWLAPVRWGEAKATPPAYDEQRTQYEQDEGADILSEIDGRTVTTIPGLASGNAIGMALFPDASDLSLGDKAGRFGRGDMKPSLPIRSSRRPINQAMTPEFPTPEQDYLGANGYFSNFR